MYYEYLEKLYYNYFHLNEEELYFEFNNDFFKFLDFLKNRDEGEPLNKNIELFKKQKNKTFREKIIGSKNNEDVPEIEKEFLEIRRPLICSFTKVSLLDEIFEVKESEEIFGISISEILIILNAIFIKIFAFNESFLNERKRKVYKKIFGDEFSCFFSPENIRKLVPDINIQSIKIFLSIFSIDYNQINKKEDSYKILKINDEYILFSIHEFFDQAFNNLEKIIISFYIKNNMNIELYFDKRGKAFEKMVFNITKDYFSNGKTHLNKCYMFNGKEQELDVLQCFKKNIIYIECKSSDFNMAEIENDKKLFKKMVSSFGKGYKSIDTFHKFCLSDSAKKDFYKSKTDFISINTFNKNIITIMLTLNDITYISGNIHILKNKSFKKPNYYPITLGFSDYFAMITFTKKNSAEEKFVDYLIKRHEIINKKVKYGLGSDELDSFGMLTDNREKYNINRFINAEKDENTQGEIHFNVNNGFYRESINDYLDGTYLPFFIENFMSENIKTILKELFNIV